MDLDQLRALQSTTGQDLLARATALAPDESKYLQCFNKLSKLGPSPLVRAALQTAWLRCKARAKFTLADQMFFLKEALEQSSSETVARHRARRFQSYPRIADLCCGIGGDSLALATVAPIVAVDHDPVRLEMARLNVAVYGGADRATFIEADVLRDPLPVCDGVFVDPSRRVQGRRTLSIHACEPSTAEIVARFSDVRLLGIKLAPGLPLHELDEYRAEIEFVSLHGELKECILWLGSEIQPVRRATLLPEGHTLLSAKGTIPSPDAPEEWIYDPDPAVIRAGLLSELAELLDAHPLDAGIGLLSSRVRASTPFARCYRLEEVLPVHVQQLRERLRQRNVGHVQWIRRGSPIDPVELDRKLKLKGDDPALILLTKVAGRPHALLLQRSGSDVAS